jgi:ubiquinone biosynthesis protein COQ9
MPTDPPKTDDPGIALLDAALPHVAFDGWSEATFRAAVAESGVEPALARALCPRGAVDLAIAYHRRGDAAMAARLAAADLSAMRLRDRIATAVRFRLEAVEDREVVRRGTALFALPQHAGEGARAVWDTADLIWRTLGDTSDDVNWYTKRMTLSGVYGSTVLYWLGDDSPGYSRTWEFLDRRIDGVMRFEKVKARVRDSALLKPFLAAPAWMLGRVKAPSKPPRTDMPGTYGGETQE